MVFHKIRFPDERRYVQELLNHIDCAYKLRPMYPFLLPEIFSYALPMYDLLILMGLSIMIIYVVTRLEKKEGFSRKQTTQIVLFIGISLVFALLFSMLLDGIFHSLKEGELTFGSINFLGALIGGFIAFLWLMKFFYKGDKSDHKKISNVLITGVVIAHAFGRVGCFCAGCCYGIPTSSYLGVVFPHGHAHEAFPDTHLYPTQLFEAFFLLALFTGMHFMKSFKTKEIETYLIAYGVFRFSIEFIRGDNRGIVIPIVDTMYNTFPTPSQMMSLMMILLGGFLLYKNKTSLMKTSMEPVA